MGRIKTTFIKSIGKDLYQKHADKFTTDFSKNKDIINKLIDIKSKKLKNILAGYITSLKRQSSR